MLIPAVSIVCCGVSCSRYRHGQQKLTSAANHKQPVGWINYRGQRLVQEKSVTASMSTLYRSLFLKKLVCSIRPQRLLSLVCLFGENLITKKTFPHVRRLRDCLLLCYGSWFFFHFLFCAYTDNCTHNREKTLATAFV